MDFGGNCGLGGQVHTGVGPGHSLSWPHSAHSRSRDLRRVCFLLLICFGFFVFVSLAFSVCFHFWGSFIWLISLFFFVFSLFLMCVGVCVCVCDSLCVFVCLVLLLPFVLRFCLSVCFRFCVCVCVHVSLCVSVFLFFVFFPFLPHPVACRVLVLQTGIRPEPVRWESQVQDVGLPENSQPQGILIGKSSPRNLPLNTKIWLHPTASKLQC